MGPKGALKKFSPDGKLLGSISLLAPPVDLALSRADGTPVVLVSYRSVSEYHGAQVREGIVVVRAADSKRVGEIKTSAGSACIDKAGRVWTADVAGHIACCDLKGRKLFDVAASPTQAVPDARLPAGSPLPVFILSDEKRTIWALFTLRRRLVSLDQGGSPRGDAKLVPEAAGALSLGRHACRPPRPRRQDAVAALAGSGEAGGAALLTDPELRKA